MDQGSVELPSPFHLHVYSKKQVYIKPAYFVHSQAKTNVLFIDRNKKKIVQIFLLVNFIERTRLEENSV